MMSDIKENIFYLKNKIFRKSVYSEYELSRNTEKQSRYFIEKLNWHKRKEIIKYVYDNIPFYRKYYDINNFHPTELIDESNWENVPIIDKQHIRENKNEMILPGISSKHLIPVKTGGSTGEPLLLYRDKRFPEEVIKWRMLNRWNAHPGSDIGMLWRIPGHTARPLHIIKNKAIWWPTKRFKFDVSDLSQDKLHYIYSKIKFHKPKIIWGYVGAIEQLALFMKDSNLFFNYVPLVWVTAAPVSEIQRALFAQIFKTDVLNQYACSEVHWVASNIPGTQIMTVEDDYRHVDIVDDKDSILGYNEEGDLILTDLENKAFPLIKYRVGDRTKRIKPLDSSMPFSCISPVKGRVTDSIKTPDGITLSGEYLTTVFDDHIDVVRQFQIIQKKNYSILIKTVVNTDQPKNVIDKILMQVRKDLLDKINNELSIEVVVVDKIKHDRGKIRFIKSELLN